MSYTEQAEVLRSVEKTLVQEEIIEKTIVEDEVDLSVENSSNVSLDFSLQ